MLQILGWAETRKALEPILRLWLMPLTVTRWRRSAHTLYFLINIAFVSIFVNNGQRFFLFTVSEIISW